jgi:ribosomal protein S12 methylthiotransferase accessory factor
MQGIPWSVDRLAQFGIETFGLNLTRRHFAVPAAHVIPSGLQFMRSEIITPRLADMIARTGGVRPIPMVSP